MIGAKKTLHSANPSRDVWGAFSMKLVGAYLVHIDEVCLKSTRRYMNQIQELTSEPVLMVNGKGVPQF